MNLLIDSPQTLLGTADGFAIPPLPSTVLNLAIPVNLSPMAGRPTTASFSLIGWQNEYECENSMPTKVDGC